MAERHKSKDGHSETSDLVDPDGSVEQAGRTGGTLQRDIATQDELKRSTERPAGATRVHKSDERGDRDA